MKKKSNLIVVEGPDGLGKSTLTAKLCDTLNASGNPATLMSFPGRNEGTLGKVVYDFHHAPDSFGIRQVSALSLQLLHVAAHIDAIERVIVPTLLGGTTVILDRFWWSTLVYGLASGADESVLRKMLEVEMLVWGHTKPDLAVLLQRSKPFVPRPEMSKWAVLSKEYLRLAESERKSYPVEIINLDNGADNLVPIIVDRLPISE